MCQPEVTGNSKSSNGSGRRRLPFALIVFAVAGLIWLAFKVLPTASSIGDGTVQTGPASQDDQRESLEFGPVTEISAPQLISYISSDDEQLRQRVLSEIGGLSLERRTELFSDESVVAAFVPLLADVERRRDLYSWFSEAPPSARGPLVDALESQDRKLQAAAL